MSDQRDRPGAPTDYVWGAMGMPRPETTPREMPGAWEGEQTMLVDRSGRPILIKRRREFGFRPPESKP